MPTILSTKILTQTQKRPLLNAGVDLVEHDFIRIDPVDFEMPAEVENAIFTSKKAPFAFGISPQGGKSKNLKTNIENCFCVGNKTKKLLEESGIKVIASADYGKDLAGIIVEKHSTKHFTFFCGNRRRDELPEILKKNKVSLKEIVVYKTKLTPKKFQQEFDGILFFSPSGVESFCLENELKNSTAFCIGKTTASEAEKYTENIVVAGKPSVENLTCKVSKTL